VKEKTYVRYLGFRSASNGGRVFDFCVSAPPSPDVLTSLEIPADLFTGTARIRLQEGVGICYSKLKHIVENTELTDIPGILRLTASDLAGHRDLAAPSGTKPSSNAVSLKDDAPTLRENR